METPLASLFVTKVFRGDLNDRKGFSGLLEELGEACAFIAAEDAAGKRWCKDKGYRGYTSYASLTDLPTRDTAFGKLKKLLDREVAAFADALYLDLGSRRLVLDHLWINVLKPGGVHTSHIHPHSVISGTLYVDVPPGAGALKLEDPRLSMMMAAPTRRADAPEEMQAFVYLKPEPGKLFMWESWLRHEVEQNQGRQERVSISFNYNWD
jgi:uncharacterized protein (TIGR02466 family)